MATEHIRRDEHAEDIRIIRTKIKSIEGRLGGIEGRLGGIEGRLDDRSNLLSQIIGNAAVMEKTINRMASTLDRHDIELGDISQSVKSLNERAPLTTSILESHTKQLTRIIEILIKLAK